MSQAGRYNSNTPAPGTVLSLEGNTGAAVSPDGGGTIFVVGSGDISVSGNPLTNTLTIADSGGGVMTIDANTGLGSIAGSTVQITTPSSNGDGTSVFTGDGSPGTVMTLTFTDGNGNVGFGNNAMTFVQSGSAAQNVALGVESLIGLVDGEDNCAIGYLSFASLIGTGIGDASGNVGVGQSTGLGVVSGSFNIIVGSSSGSTYSGAESSNILLSSSGVTGESNVIRIGTTGTGSSEQSLAYIAGIQGVTPTNGPVQTVIIGTDGQLGSMATSPSGIITIDGNSSFATGSTVTITTGALNENGTALFTGNGTSQVLLTFSDVNNNTGLGAAVLDSASFTGSANTVFGANAGSEMTSGNSNTIVGEDAADVLLSGHGNVGVGVSALGQLVTGSNNTAIGSGAGDLYTGAESNNIIVGLSGGVVGESNVLRIGSGTGTFPGQLNKAFISGINGISVGSVASVVAISGDQLGSATITGGTGITVTPTANTITIATTGATASSFPTNSGTATPSAGALSILGGLNLTTSGSGSTVTIAETQAVLLNNYTGITNASSPYSALTNDYYISANVTAGAITIRLPNAPTTNRVFIIKDKVGLSATSNITVTTVGGSVTIDGSTSLVMNTNFQSVNLAFNGTSYEAF